MPATFSSVQVISLDNTNANLVFKAVSYRVRIQSDEFKLSAGFSTIL